MRRASARRSRPETYASASRRDEDRACHDHPDSGPCDRCSNAQPPRVIVRERHHHSPGEQNRSTATGQRPACEKSRATPRSNPNCHISGRRQIERRGRQDISARHKEPWSIRAHDDVARRRADGLSIHAAKPTNLVGLSFTRDQDHRIRAPFDLKVNSGAGPDGRDSNGEGEHVHAYPAETTTAMDPCPESASASTPVRLRSPLPERDDEALRPRSLRRVCCAARSAGFHRVGGRAPSQAVLLRVRERGRRSTKEVSQASAR